MSKPSKKTKGPLSEADIEVALDALETRGLVVRTDDLEADLQAEAAFNDVPAPSSDNAIEQLIDARSAPYDVSNADAHKLIYNLERAAIAGHSLDRDRALMLEAAVALRSYIGLTPQDKLIYPPPSYYAPVANDPPAGHSLPYPDDPKDVR